MFHQVWKQKKNAVNVVLNQLIDYKEEGMEELKSCPFCGGEEISTIESYDVPKFSKKSLPDFVYVGCPSCGIGYQEETEEEAIEAWNRRIK